MTSATGGDDVPATSVGRSRPKWRRANRQCLVVTKLLPFPAFDGGKQRTLATVSRLAARADVTLIGFDEGDGGGAQLRDLGVRMYSVPWPTRPLEVANGWSQSLSLSSARFWSRRLAGLVQQAVATGPPETLIVEYAQLEPLVRGVQAKRTILAMHNIESALVASFAATRSCEASRLAYRGEAAMLGRLERRLLKRADVVSVVSDHDRERLPAGPARILVCPNGHDPCEPLPPSDEPVAVFVAHLGWAPNVDAAKWLVEHVWPAVVLARPDARLLLVGRDPDRQVRALGGPSVAVTGTVPDVRPFLQRAQVALAPLRAGGGTRLKILEALFAARPVVATTVGAEGLEVLRGRGLIVADDASAFAGAIVALLNDPAGAARLGRQAHEATLQYSWDATLGPLLEAAVQ